MIISLEDQTSLEEKDLLEIYKYQQVICIQVIQ